MDWFLYDNGLRRERVNNGFQNLFWKLAHQKSYVTYNKQKKMTLLWHFKICSKKSIMNSVTLSIYCKCTSFFSVYVLMSHAFNYSKKQQFLIDDYFDK